MHVVVAPNALRECMSASDAASAIADGVGRSPRVKRVTLLPVADGGDGTLAVLAASWPGCALIQVPAHTPLGEPSSSSFLWSAREATAVIEMSQIVGLRSVPSERRDPWRSSSYGVGQVIRAALDRGARRILVGAGGTITLDAGAGAIAALGGRFLDDRGRRLDPTPAGLCSLDRLDLSEVDSRLSAVDLLVLADVNTPLADNARLYGVAKGISSEAADAFVQPLTAVARLFPCRDILAEKWLGAGGGIAALLTAVVGARAVSGADHVLHLLGAADKLSNADLVFTAEGRLDRGTFEGKAPHAVMRQARACGCRCVFLVGGLEPGLAFQLPAHTHVEVFGSASTVDPAVARRALADAAARVLGQFERSDGDGYE